MRAWRLRRLIEPTFLVAGMLAATAAERATIAFDADWRFLKGDAPGAEQLAFDDSAWRKL